jgi:hypothetical protein
LATCVMPFARAISPNARAMPAVYRAMNPLSRTRVDIELRDTAGEICMPPGTSMNQPIDLNLNPRAASHILERVDPFAEPRSSCNAHGINVACGLHFVKQLRVAD